MPALEELSREITRIIEQQGKSICKVIIFQIKLMQVLESDLTLAYTWVNF